MPQRLDIWQANMLNTGHELGAEILAPSPHCRAFMCVRGYSIDPAKHGIPSKFLNADHSDVRYMLRVFEVDEADLSAVSADSWHADYYEKDIINLNGITSIEELETLLCAYVDDFAILVNSLHVPYPL